GVDGGGRRNGLGLAAEALLLAEAHQGWESVDLGLESGLAPQGAAMHGPPVGGLAPGLELLLQPRANRTGTLRQERGGTGRSDGRGGWGRTSDRPSQFRDRDAERSKAEDGGRPIVHSWSNLTICQRQGERLGRVYRMFTS